MNLSETEKEAAGFGTGGSAGLEEYGVWVKSAPEDVTAKADSPASVRHSGEESLAEGAVTALLRQIAGDLASIKEDFASLRADVNKIVSVFADSDGREAEESLEPDLFTEAEIGENAVSFVEEEPVEEASGSEYAVSAETAEEPELGAAEEGEPEAEIAEQMEPAAEEGEYETETAENETAKAAEGAEETAAEIAETAETAETAESGYAGEASETAESGYAGEASETAESGYAGEASETAAVSTEMQGAADEPAAIVLEEETPAGMEYKPPENQEFTEELKYVLSYINNLLGALPDEKIDEFANSEHFEHYRKVFQELGIAG